MNHPTLNLPPITANTRMNPTTHVEEIFDSQRRKYVRLTPEEWVRQHFVSCLVTQLGYPQGRLQNEVAIRVVFNQFGKPALIVEYKAPTVRLSQKVFDQIVRYNYALRVQYLMVSNGIQHYCCRLNPETNRFEFLQELPRWEQIEGQLQP